MNRNDKEAVRKKILSLRHQIPFEDRQNKSRLIMARLIQLHDFSMAQNIMVYVSFSSEVVTDELIRSAMEKEKRIVVPVVDLHDHQLILSEIKHQDELVPSTYGIREPKKVRPIRPDQVELFILPGVAFDEQGMRLGYGGGYFDRLLKTKTRFQKLVGLAYEMQIQEELPYMSYDVPVDMVITEEKVRLFKS
jgi:5-formyltetrahydrofolate cyclo-ligase